MAEIVKSCRSGGDFTLILPGVHVGRGVLIGHAESAPFTKTCPETIGTHAQSKQNIFPQAQLHLRRKYGK